MANNVDPDQTAPSGAVWSGSALFAYAIMSKTLVYEFLEHLLYMFWWGNKTNITSFWLKQVPYLDLGLQ